MSEDQMALQTTLHYYNKYMKYGAPGRAGTYKEIFTRAYNSNILYIEPGRGGQADNLADPEVIKANPSQYENKANTDDIHKGRETKISYNCTLEGGVPKKCAKIEVSGGVAGAGGLSEAPEAMKYTGAEIKYYLGKINKGEAVKKCSYLAPAKEGCTGENFEEQGKGQESEFQEVANKMDSFLNVKTM